MSIGMRLLCLGWLGFGLLGAEVAVARSLPAVESCTAQASVGALCGCRIADLHPTQISVGMRQVEGKAQELSELSSSELEKYEQKESEPSVIGPGGKLYIIDHHHLARALVLLNVSQTYCRIEANLSALTEKAFWSTMEREKWVYPFDEQGRGPLPISQLPDSVGELRDDPYRSLAGAVRKAGGYEKSSVPFAEFQWANFFRSRIPAKTVNKDFKKAVKRGVELAHSPEAEGLPGR